MFMAVLHQSRIVLVYNLLDVGHSTVADFDGAAIENLFERVVCCRYVVNYLKELSAYVCCNSLIIRWVEPSYVSRPFHSSVVFYAVCPSILKRVLVFAVS